MREHVEGHAQHVESHPQHAEQLPSSVEQPSSHAVQTFPHAEQSPPDVAESKANVAGIDIGLAVHHLSSMYPRENRRMKKEKWPPCGGLAHQAILA